MTTEAFEKVYRKLNKAQKEAVDTIEGPVMVIAGPGSGKTQILSLRVANILLKTDTRPSNILCLTFTDSAAVNMRKRLSEMIGPDAYRVAIYTFHSFGTDIIERYPEHFFQGARFAPADDLAQIEVLEEILEELPHDNPLRSVHPEQGFTYLSDLKQAIGSLKKAGIAPVEFKAALAHIKDEAVAADAILSPLFDARLSMKLVAELRKGAEEVRAIDSGTFPLPHFAPYADTLADALDSALDDAEEMGKTEPLSRLKSSLFGKTDDGGRILKDLANMEKMESLADIYEKYRVRMYEAGAYDFDDMILEVIQAVESDAGLRAELQEQYQFVLVDEFQDTNDAQMRLLRGLLDAEVNEGRPNIMVVGDDDQAIYKFQGAELSNILNFRSQYKEPKIVTMAHNYRSTQVILDIAKLVIERGEERLENILPEVEKDLVAANDQIAKGDIRSKTFPTIGHEYRFIAKEIRRLLDAGEEANNIAVIARKHAFLEGLVPYLNDARVPIRYERQSDVLKEPHVRELIVMARFATSLMKNEREEADHLLPEILSFPFWGVSRKTIWQISVDADRSRRLWLEIMLDHEDENIRRIAEFFIDLSQIALYDTMERVVDILIGSHLALAADDEYDDEAVATDVVDILNPGQSQKSVFISPFKEYYWSIDRLKESKADYLIFLSSLRTFVAAVRGYKRGELAKLEDLVAFVDLHEKNRLVIPDTSAFANGLDAISLVTAHKAKGLEWQTVFVINCRNDVWAGRGPGRKLSFPLNLPITPAGDTVDDQLRLFYVALTRAKRNLYLTASATTESGKEALRLQFLFPRDGSKAGSANSDLAKLLEFAEESFDMDETIEALATATSSLSRNPLLYDEEAFLKTLVENYCMSVTHMNNFLNVAKGGPAYFFEQNLLRFPQEPNLSSKFGTAMHALIERVYNHLKFEGGMPEQKTLLSWLDRELRQFRMTERDFELLRERGRKSIASYIEGKKDSFKPTDKIEVNFRNQGVALNGAELTGKIDKMVFKEGGAKEKWSVHDFKTGRALADWDGKDDYDRTKLHNYKYQLIFYKLLVENSREFCDDCVAEEGCLEFIEPIRGKIVELPLAFEPGDVERVKKLAEIVYKKIVALDFPDVSGYDQNVNGILAFEEDLLEGKI
ncbi:MAG TPA: ATP-dependent DNA helicase [Candidatus Paceibacterota bacterium]|jgi:DNA helicase-2/ATP-dependent DNA helicase PcrA|nr:ATP-dependent DNA helicase [Candidatus Paceibacterota bacterium]